MDAVADVTAVCMLMEYLSPEQVVVSPVHVGSGQVRTAHGVLPVPAPATAYILRDVPVYGGKIPGELCTPTGAALLKHFVTTFGNMPVMKTKAIGYGCGNGSSKENNGLTDSMQYHTGTDGETRNIPGHTQYRYIEDLWSNVLEWCDGIYFSGTSVYAIKNPANFSDTTGGTKVGTRPSQAGLIKAYNHPTSSGFEYALYPSALADESGSNKYICDNMVYAQIEATPGVVLAIGSWYGTSNSRGLFFMYDGRVASYGGNVSGSRLMVLP